MFQEFTPGERSLCVANPNYWEEGKPYVDEWEDISIDDPAARLNALLGGEIDMMCQIEPTQAKVHLEDGQIQVLGRPSPRRSRVPDGRRRRPVRRSARAAGAAAGRLIARG